MAAGALSEGAASASGAADLIVRPPRLLLGVIAFLATVATGICAYLLYRSIVGGGQVAGCGPGSGCGQVLSSRWSRWFGVPVSAPAAGVYAGIVLASILAMGRGGSVIVRMGWTLLIALSMTALASAAWFVGLQFFSVGGLCPWCMSAHACGVVIAVLTTVALWRVRSRERSFAAALRGGRSTAPLVQTSAAGGAGAASSRVRGVRIWPALLLSVLLLGGLAAGQFLSSPPPVADYHLEVSGKVIDFKPSAFPIVGPPQAPHLLVVMFDYTCPHCQKTHPLLAKVRRRFAGQLAVVALPVPINVHCNPAVIATPRRSLDACDLARIALAVWIAKPDAFEQMDHWLFESPEPRLPIEARAYAAKLVGQEAFDRAKIDPRVDDTLRRSVQLYIQLGGGPIPKIILRHDDRNGHIITGTITDEQKLIQLIEQDLGVKSAG